MSAVMLDLETLSTSPNAVILSLGAVVFDPHSLSPPKDWILLKFDVDDQTARGRHVQPDTLEWWGRQNPEAIEAAMSTEDRTSVLDCLDQLTRFVLHADEIWCQGPVFDIVILEDIYRQYQQHVPWPYWKIRDSRTLFKSLNFDSRSELRLSGANHHNALDDAVIQALALQQCFHLLKEKSVMPAK
jgi:hypothetical protein